MHMKTLLTEDCSILSDILLFILLIILVYDEFIDGVLEKQIDFCLVVCNKKELKFSLYGDNGNLPIFL